MDTLSQGVITILTRAAFIYDIITNTPSIGYFVYETLQKTLLNDLNWLAKHNAGLNIIDGITSLLDLIGDTIFDKI